MIVFLVLIAQTQLADSLYAHGYFEEARIEYKRAFFFYPALKQDAAARSRYAISVLKTDPSQGTSQLYSLVEEFPDLPDSIKVEVAKQLISTERYYLAINLLEGTEERKLLGLCYLLDGQFFNARATFIESGSYDIATQIDDYLARPKKSERTAALFSLILPGTGQIYSGNIWQGIRDFLFNVGSGYLFYNALKQQKYVDAVLIFIFLINRFYLGSVGNAQRSAAEYNEKNHEEWLETLIDTRFPDRNTKNR